MKYICQISTTTTIQIPHSAKLSITHQCVIRIKSFQLSLLNEKTEIKISNIDIRNYAKYILRDGRVEEKRELLSCLKSTVCLKERKLCRE